MPAEMNLLQFNRLQKAFHLAPAFVERELESWMQSITMHMQAEVQERTPTRDGTLRASIGSEVQKVGQFGVEGIIGTPLDYAPPVEYGAKPHDIVPKNGKALMFGLAIAGVGTINLFAKKVHHPGSKGAFMFTQAFAENEMQVQDDFARFVDHVFVKISEGAR